MVVFCLLIAISSLLSASSNLLEDIKKSVNLTNDEYLLIVYLEPSNCAKCYIEPLEIIKRLEKEQPNSKYKIIALIRCDRDIEMNVFKRQINWQYSMYRDDGKARSRLGAETETMLSVFDYSGNKSVHLRSGNLVLNTRTILDFMN